MSVGPIAGQPDPYGLRDVSPVDYQTQRQAEDIADQNLPGGTGKPSDPRAALEKIRVQNKAVAEFNSKLPAEVQALGEGLQMRSAPPFEAPNYEAYSHAELRQMVTQGVHAGTVGEVGDTWLQLGDDLACFRDEFRRALDTSATTWTGANADAARQAVVHLANAGGTMGQAAQLAGMVTHQVSRALSLANHHMPAPPPKTEHPFDAHTARHRLQRTTDPIALGTQAAADHTAATHAGDAHRRAARIVREYDQTVAESSAHMPVFEAPPQIGQPPPPPPRPRPIRPGPPTPVGPVDGGTSVAAVPDATSAAAYTDPAAQLPYGAGFGSTDPSGWNATGTAGPAGDSAGFAGALDGPRSLAVSEGGLPRPGAGFAPATGTTGGSGPFGAMPPGGRGRERDQEHKSPTYLVEPDPDLIFGLDQRTAPPVIE